MRLQLCPNRPSRRDRGFTLVELLVIAPVAILVIAGIISLMVTLVGDSVISRDRSIGAYNLQNALDRIEQDARLATLFLDNYSLLNSPQGRDDGTAAFSSSTPNNDLIISQFATTASPLSTSRQIVYYKDQPNPCGTSKMLNAPLTVKIIYFVKNGSLWRRTIVPDWSLSATDQTGVCDTPWQRDTCSLSATFNAYCQTRDELVLDSVNSMTVTYYTSLNVVTTNPLSASSVKVVVTQFKSVAGETVATSGVARATHTNFSTDTIPDAPSDLRVYNQGSTSANHPLRSSFTWDPAKNARYYKARYKVNGGSWSAYSNLTSLIFAITAGRPLDTITIGVISANDIGQSAETQFSYQRPQWTNCELENGWVRYDPAFPAPSFTLTSSNVLLMKGLIKSGPTGMSTICTLPSTLAPAKAHIFAVVSGASTYGGPVRVDVYSDGRVYNVNGANDWLSLEQIAFVPASQAFTWVTPATPYLNSYTAWDPANWQSLRYGTDSSGRTHVNGLVKVGTVGDNVEIINLPAGYRANEYYHFIGHGDVNSNGWNSSGNGFHSGNGSIVAKGYGGNYLSIQNIFYPSTYAGWTNLTLQNGWQHYGAPFTYPAYTKGTDGIVSLKGLVKNSGTGMCPTQVIATLPAGYRPKERHAFIVGAAFGVQHWGRIDVMPDGSVYCISGNLAWTSLDNVFFLAEQ